MAVRHLAVGRGRERTWTAAEGHGVGVVDPLPPARHPRRGA